MVCNGVNVVGQVGFNWVYVSGLGVDGICQYCFDLLECYGLKFNMVGYVMVEVLCVMNVEKVVLNVVYYWFVWWQGIVGFLKEVGFDVFWVGNFYD